MKQQHQETINNYRQRINKVLVYINNHLDEKLTIEILASISSFSPFHFHRIIKAHLGEPLLAYIIRLRLDTAAKLLRLSSESISDIAWKIGYETPAAFTKAFKKRFGVSPQDFREKTSYILHHENYLHLPESLNPGQSPKFKTISDKKVIFVQTIGKYGDENIGAAWNKVIAFAREKKLFGWGTETIGISHDDPSITEEEKCRYDACLSVKKNVKPEGEVGVQTIKGGKYAIFLHKGSYNYIGETYSYIYRNWFPHNELLLRNEPLLEIYLNNPENTKTEKLLTEIWVPIN